MHRRSRGSPRCPSPRRRGRASCLVDSAPPARTRSRAGAPHRPSPRAGRRVRAAAWRGGRQSRPRWARAACRSTHRSRSSRHRA
ncbi:MAG: hypothetical protein FJX74_18865 [Armatimonadetes bacterium]|nr:hypothetical protein [Armatimonadota bacterium]